MPLIAGGSEQLPQRVHGVLPDLNDPFTTEEEMPTRVLISMEIPNSSPASIPNFDQLPPDVRKRIAERYRFMGIRLRTDLEKNSVVPLGRETMEI